MKRTSINLPLVFVAVVASLAVPVQAETRLRHNRDMQASCVGILAAATMI